MPTATYPSEQFPAPPPVQIEVPDTWEFKPLPNVVLAARQTEQRPDFTPNVIVRVGTRPALDQPADVVMEVTGAMQDRPGSTVSEPETLDLGGRSWIRIVVTWSDPQGLPIRQEHLSTGIPRDEVVQDFYHLTGSTGGAGIDTDIPAVQGVLNSVRVDA
jgi:hypothetical protein